MANMASRKKGERPILDVMFDMSPENRAILNMGNCVIKIPSDSDLRRPIYQGFARTSYELKIKKAFEPRGIDNINPNNTRPYLRFLIDGCSPMVINEFFTPANTPVYQNPDVIEYNAALLHCFYPSDFCVYEIPPNGQLFEDNENDDEDDNLKLEKDESQHFYMPYTSEEAAKIMVYSPSWADLSNVKEVAKSAIANETKRGQRSAANKVLGNLGLNKTIAQYLGEPNADAEHMKSSKKEREENFDKFMSKKGGSRRRRSHKRGGFKKTRKYRRSH